MPLNPTALAPYLLDRLPAAHVLNMPWLVPRRPASTDTPNPSVTIPNPAPTPPPGLDAKMDVLLSWGKWGVLICGVAGLFICAGQMAIGRKNRSTFAADGATGIPWVLGGLSLAATASAIVGVFFK